MKKLGALFSKEPALVGTLVAAALPVAIVIGVDPEIGGSVGTLITVAVGIWIRSQVTPAPKA